MSKPAMIKATFARFTAASAMFGALLFAGSVAAEEGEGLAPANVRVESTASLQRGARLYFNYCSGCHSIKYMSYSRLGQDLQLSNEEVLNNFAFTGARIGDQVVSNM